MAFCTLLILFLGANPYSNAFEKDEYLIQNFTVEEGLPLNSINRIIQDNRGYLYFSTLDGIARYDGYDFIIYNSGNTPELPSNRIMDMHLSDAGDLWFLNDQGMVTRKSGSDFFTYSHLSGDLPGYAKRMLSDHSGRFWIISSEGAVVYDPENDAFIISDDPLMQSHSYVAEPLGESGILIINDHGLIAYHRGETRLLFETADFPIPHALTESIHQDDSGRIWISGEDGIFRFSPDEGRADVVYIPEKENFVVWNVHQPSEGSLRINSTYGFYTFDETRNSFIREDESFFSQLNRSNIIFETSDGDKLHMGVNNVDINNRTVLRSEGVQSGFIDKEGSGWVATFTRGVYQIRKSGIVNIASDQVSGFENSYSVIQTSDGSIWAGTLRNGIFRFSDSEIMHWNASNSSLDRNFNRFLFEDTDGTVFAGLWGAGLWEFTGDDWAPADDFAAVKSGNHTVEAMHRHGDGRLFVGTSGPLYVKDQARARLFDSSRQNAFNGVRVIRENDNGRIFLGTNGNGITIIDEGRIRNYRSANSGLSTDFIRDIYLQSADTLWAATENFGLVRIITDDSGRAVSFDNITVQDGLSHNSLHRIIPDDHGYLWISSNSGIMRIPAGDLNRYANGEIPTLSLATFSEREGMLNREANGGVQTAGVKLASGDILFPNQSGLTLHRVSEDYGTANRLVSNPVIESVQFSDRVINVTGNTVEIPQGQRNFRIKFTAPNFQSPARVLFYYKLEGVNPDWERAGSGREAVLTNVPPGNHQFRINVFQEGRMETPAEATMLVTVPGYFYESAWFLLILFILAAGLVFAGVKYRIRVLEKNEKKLQELVDRQTEDLRAAAEQKSRFFSGITHELKTPLSLIVGPLQDILESPETTIQPGIRSQLSVVQRNSLRLNSLTDQILDVTRLNADALRLNHQPLDPVQITRQIAGQFYSRLEQKLIHLDMQLDTFTDPVYVDPDAWERILINLLSNAIKFSPEDGTIFIRLENHPESFSLSVRDEGPGIAAADQQKVFEYLYQAGDNSAAGGTGIGLYLVKGLAEHMKGSVRLISEEGHGAEFIVTLKKGHDHFSDQDSVSHEPLKLASEIMRHPETDDAVPEAAPGNGPSQTILVVEDNDDFRKYLEDILSAEFRVVTAG